MNCPRELLEPGDSDLAAELFRPRSHAPGPAGKLPITPQQLAEWTSGDLFGWSHNAGMGWAPEELGRPEYLILSTQGGLRGENGRPLALGYHTGHWEIGLLTRAAAEELRRRRCIPFAAYVSDPCDGRTQGTPGMMDSLPYRNDAAQVFGRLIRSLPRRCGVLGIATCDKGLPAMMMALAGAGELPGVLVPGGVMLAGEDGSEDTAKVQTIGARAAHGLLDLQTAAELGCRACASPGGGCQFLGTAATSQVVAEALGMTVPHAALSPSGQPIWLDMARRSAAALVHLDSLGLRSQNILIPAAIENAMVVHAAFGGSTNLLLHIPAIAHAAGLSRPTPDDWRRINRQSPRLVDALPNGPVGFATARVFLAGGVPEVMLHLRRLGLLQTRCRTVTGETWDTLLDWWRESERRRALQAWLREQDGIDFRDVIATPEHARGRGMTPTLTLPGGNLAPEGAVVKSTAIARERLDAQGIYRHRGPARVFTRETDAMAAIKAGPPEGLRAGDILVLIGRGPLGAGMEEIYQITSALRHLPWGSQITVLTDARFSGVSTGACIGHISPEALAGGPIGKLRDGDWIEVEIDCVKLTGRLDYIGPSSAVEMDSASRVTAARELAARQPHPRLAPDPRLPADTRLWALLQNASGGVWGGCVYDPARLESMLSGEQQK